MSQHFLARYHHKVAMKDSEFTESWIVAVPQAVDAGLARRRSYTGTSQIGVQTRYPVITR